MKKNMMLVGLMVISTIIFAQRHSADHKDRSSSRAEKMKTELSLSDDQYAKVKAINEKFATSHSKLRSDTSLTVGTSHKKMEKLRTDKEAQIKSVLTPEQLTKWTALKTKRNEDKKNHKRGRGHGGHGDGGKGDKG